MYAASVSSASINNLGRVAFEGTLTNDQRGAFARDGAAGPTTTIATTLGAPYGPFYFYTAIDDSGMVAFHAQLDAGGEGIFKGNGSGAATTVFRSGASTGTNYTGFGDLAMNAGGVVAARGYINFSAGNGIYTGDGSNNGAMTPVFTTNGSGTEQAVAINNAGTVAWYRSNSIVDGIYARAGAPGTAGGVGNIITVIDSTSQQVSGLNRSSPALNGAGTIAFVASQFDVLNYGIYLRTGVGTGASLGSLTNLIDSSGLFSGFDALTINDVGEIAFSASLDNGGRGVFVLDTTVAAGAGGVGAPAGLRRVISVGDALFGSTVVNVNSDRQAINNAGQVVFDYTLANGRTGVAVAARPSVTTVPEPGTLSLLPLGALALASIITRRRSVHA